MSTDWKPGDRALRITDSTPLTPAQEEWFHMPNGPTKKGTTYLVAEVSEEDFIGWVATSLVIAGHPFIELHNGRDTGFHHINFRKIVPDCDREEMELVNVQPKAVKRFIPPRYFPAPTEAPFHDLRKA